MACTRTMHVPLLLSALLLCHFQAARADRNPCHADSWLNGRDLSNQPLQCEEYVLPAQLCSKCKLRAFRRDGNFKNCANIYNVDDRACRAQLRLYSRLNPCDVRRALQVGKMRANRAGLDYFVYAVCEECCDCVPRGALPGEFEDRLGAGTLIKADRANCPLHAHYDICRVWPNVRHVKGEGERSPPELSGPVKARDRKFPKVCPIFSKWKDGPNGQDLYNKDEAKIPKTIRKFLDRFLEAAQCEQKTLWNKCVALERAQNRL